MKWVSSLGRNGSVRRVSASSTKGGKHSNKFDDDELRSRFEQLDESTSPSSSSSSSALARSANQALTPVNKLSSKYIPLASPALTPKLRTYGGDSWNSCDITHPSTLASAVHQQDLNNNTANSTSTSSSHDEIHDDDNGKNKPHQYQYYDGDDDASSRASHDSGISSASAFSATYGKLKRYLPKKNKHRNNCDRKHHHDSSSKTNNNRKQQPKYHRPNKQVSSTPPVVDINAPDANRNKSGDDSSRTHRVSWSKVKIKTPQPSTIHPPAPFEDVTRRRCHCIINSGGCWVCVREEEESTITDAPAKNEFPEVSPTINDSSPIEVIGVRSTDPPASMLVPNSERKNSDPIEFSSTTRIEFSEASPTSDSPRLNEIDDATASPVSGKRPSISTISDGTTHQVFELHWTRTDTASGKKLCGLYSGPVTIQPHGEGTLVLLDDNDSCKLHGRWENGKLVTPLMTHDDDEEEEYPRPQENSKYSKKKSSPDENCKEESSSFKRLTTMPTSNGSADSPPSRQQGCSSTSDLKNKKLLHKDECTTTPSSNDVTTFYSKEDDYSEISYKDHKSLSSMVSDYTGVMSDYSNLIPHHLNLAELCGPVSTPTKTSPTITNQNEHELDHHHCPPRRNYSVGEVACTPRDMIVHRSKDMATQSASLLNVHDQAFIRRSNGSWTCAVLTDRSFKPKDDSSTRSHWRTTEKDIVEKSHVNLEESMLFVINEDGATKIIKKRHWGKFVRRIQEEHNEEEDKEHEIHEHGVKEVGSKGAPLQKVVKLIHFQNSPLETLSEETNEEVKEYRQDIINNITKETETPSPSSSGSGSGSVAVYKCKTKTRKRSPSKSQR